MEIINDYSIVTYPAILSGLVEVIKRTGLVDSRYMPLIAILLGGVGAWYLGFTILGGVVMGLTAVGLYEGIKGTYNEVQRRTS